MAESFRDSISVWEERRVEADEYRELDGERVLALDHYCGRGKTSRLEVGQARAERDPQPTVYGLARRAEGHPDGRFLFHSVRRGPIRSGERCGVVPAPRTASSLAAMETRIAQTARQIARCAETRDWPLSGPDGWWCSAGHCRFWSGCPGGRARP
jgi:hypothetical protein